jgi:hypothetical protein
MEFKENSDETITGKKINQGYALSLCNNARAKFLTNSIIPYLIILLPIYTTGPT